MKGKKTLSRKWARAWWVCLFGFFLSWVLGHIAPNWPTAALCLAGLALCMAGWVYCRLKLRCPYCGRGTPTTPAFWPSEKRYCPVCGKPFVYDDEDEGQE